MKNFWQKLNKQSGVSLLEVVLYVALASIIISVIGTSVHGILQIRVKGQTVTEVEQQGAQAVQKISQSIRNADSIINIVSTSTVPDFKIQRGIADVGNTGATKTAPSDFDAFSSTTSAFVLNNNNHYTNSGFAANSGNMEIDDLAGAIVLTNTSTISFYRDSGSNAIDARFHWEAWEYIGDAGGDNEFIVRGRYQITMTAGTRTGTDTVTSCTDRDKCIPFITGILNSDPNNDADQATAIATMTADNTVTVERGGSQDTTIVYGVVVEFTGSNWSVAHGRTGNVTGDTGTISLVEESVGTSGTTYNVSDWDNAIIFHQFKADDSSSNEAIADVSAVYFPGTGSDEVDWSFHSDHDASDNQHMVHILENSEMTVDRYSSSGSAEGDNNIAITAVDDLANAAVVGSANSSGGGSAYGRGWKGFYFTSASNVSAWAHRSGNTVDARIQVIQFPSTEIQVIGSVTTTTQDIVIQRGIADVANTGGNHTAPANFTEFDSMDSAFVLNSSNRYTNSGESGYNNTIYVDDMSGAVVMTATDNIDFYRQAGSKASDMRFHWESWEYVGTEGGPNEFVVRGTYQVNINAGDRVAIDTVDHCGTKSKCIPFITGILNSNTGTDARGLTAIAWMSGDNQVSVERGGNAGDTVVYGVVVEFTGSNWTVGHGRTDDVNADTGTIDLYQNSDGSSGSVFNVSNWTEAVIFHQFKADDTANNVAIADTSGTYYPGTNNDEVDWYFNGNRDGTDNQHMVHVLNNPDMNVARYVNTGSLQNDNNTVISSVATDSTAVVGSANTSGTGTAYARGLKGIYLADSSTVNAWAHRSGNTIQTRIQVIEMPEVEWEFNLQLISGGSDTIRFGLSNGKIFIQETGKYSFLTSDRVEITDLYFDDYSRSGTSGLISFGFDIRYNSDSSRNELNYNQTFQSTATILNN